MGLRSEYARVAPERSADPLAFHQVGCKAVAQLSAGITAFVISPARCAASRHASHRTLGVMGLSGAGAVNRPRGTCTVFGWLIQRRVLTQRLKRFGAQQHVAVLTPFALPDVDCSMRVAVDILDVKGGTVRPAACPLSTVVISMARWNRLLAESISRIASSRVRMIGSRHGLGYGTSSTGYILFGVLQKKAFAPPCTSRPCRRRVYALEQVHLTKRGCPFLCLIDQSGRWRSVGQNPPRPSGRGVYGSLRVITTLELFQHHFFKKLGHRTSPR